jgi:hypothetical protein
MHDMNQDDIFNDEVEQWTKSLMDDLKDELDYLGVQHYKRSPNEIALRKVLKARFYKRNGLINHIGIKMPRSAVFLEKGVSKGHPIENPRIAKKWFNPVVNRNMGALEDILVKHQLDFVTNYILIK